MLNSAAQVSVMKVVMMMMMMVVVVFLGTGAKAAPTERGKGPTGTTLTHTHTVKRFKGTHVLQQHELTGTPEFHHHKKKFLSDFPGSRLE